MFSLPEGLKIVGCYNGAANAVACDVVSMKNLIRGWFLVHHTGANDTDLTLSLYQATDVAAGTNKAVTTALPNYLDVTRARPDTLVKQTDAYSLVIDPATQNGVLWVLEVDPACSTWRTATTACTWTTAAGTPTTAARFSSSGCRTTRAQPADDHHGLRQPRAGCELPPQQSPTAVRTRQG